VLVAVIAIGVVAWFFALVHPCRERRRPKVKPRPVICCRLPISVVYLGLSGRRISSRHVPYPPPLAVAVARSGRVLGRPGCEAVGYIITRKQRAISKVNEKETKSLLSLSLTLGSRGRRTRKCVTWQVCSHGRRHRCFPFPLLAVARGDSGCAAVLVVVVAACVVPAFVTLLVGLALVPLSSLSQSWSLSGRYRPIAIPLSFH
jgi:hypothetical protein